MEESSSLSLEEGLFQNKDKYLKVKLFKKYLSFIIIFKLIMFVA
jgi:hypothetical protein